jgi:hypothetical protein
MPASDGISLDFSTASVQTHVYRDTVKTCRWVLGGRSLKIAFLSSFAKPEYLVLAEYVTSVRN